MPTGPLQHEVVMLLLAFVLCGAIGVERQLQHKSAGFRTHALVGMGSAAFTLVSAFGFPQAAGAMLDPSRIAAQVVSGVGFLGAGVIFMRRDVVKGLTTAAGIWLTAAVGMACGADMPLMAVTVVLLYLLTTLGIAPAVRRLPRPSDRSTLTLTYHEGHGCLRRALSAATEMGFHATIERTVQQHETDGRVRIQATMGFQGRPHLSQLVAELSEVEGVLSAVTSTAGASGARRKNRRRRRVAPRPPVTHG